MSSIGFVSIASLDVEKDLAILLELFPDRFQVERASKSQILVADDVTVLLYPSNHPSRVTWLTSENEILDLSERDPVVDIKSVQRFSVADIGLSGGTILRMVPRELVSSQRGRRALADYVTTEDRCADMSATAESTSEYETVELKTEVPDNLPKFPTLKSQLLHQDQLIDFPLNAREPIDFETDIFKGKILVLIRPPKPESDPYWNDRLFSVKKRNIVLQIQGKFKRQPRGQVYLGAEITQKMRVGLFTKGILSLLIRLLQSFFNDLKTAFGDDDGKELPRVAAPAHCAFERFHVTPAGQIPPEITGEPFEESDDDRARRIKKKTWEWNTTDTYSLSFYSMYVDLPTWHVVNLKIGGDIKLENLWQDSNLRIVFYEKTGDEKPHYQSSNKYACVVQLEYLKRGDSRAENQVESDTEGDDLVQVAERSRFSQTLEESPIPNRKVIRRKGSSVDFPPLMQVEAFDEDKFFDAAESHSSVEYERVLSQSRPSLAPELLKSIDSVVPAFIDLISNLNRGSYIRTYAITFGDQSSYRTVQSCEEIINASGAVDEVDRLLLENFSLRMSSSERIRRLLGLVLIRGTQEKLASFKRQRSPLDEYFLQHQEPSLPEKKQVNVLWSGYVARAISDRHWIEEWVKINGNTISFYHPDMKKAQFRVNVRSVHRPMRLPAAQHPNIPDHPIVTFETEGRCVYVMFSSERQLDNCLDTLIQLTQSDENGSLRSEDTDPQVHIMDLDNPLDEFLHKSSIWNCKHRRILNCGRFSLCTPQLPIDPLGTVETVLRRAFELSNDLDPEKRRAFLDFTATLKCVQLHFLSQSEKLVFFLNLYHVMIMHAFLVLGPPGSALKWISYFNNIAYEVNDDIFSLSELEHCIIRYKMSYPSQFLSRFVLPKSYYKMALCISDFRITFALNCGSLSNPESILIYRTDLLDEQLNYAARHYLEQASVSRRGSREVVLILPRICQWFADDFVQSSESIEGTHEQKLLHTLEPFLKEKDRRELAEFKSPEGIYDKSRVQIRFDDYNFKCRRLRLDESI